MSQPATNAAAQPDGSTSGLGSGDGFGICPTCAAALKLKKNGTFPKHRIKRQYFFGTNWHKARPWCLTYGILPNTAICHGRAQP